MSKRPRGLQASLSKKSAISATNESAEQGSGSRKRQRAQEAGSTAEEDLIAIETTTDAALHKEDSKHGDLIDLRYLYDQVKSGEEGSISMVRGMVHECDRILRKSDSAMETGTDEDDEDWTTPLPWSFHYIYAWALYRLSIFEDELLSEKKSASSMQEFQMTALERAQRARELLASPQQDKVTSDEITLDIKHWQVYTLTAAISVSLAPQGAQGASEAAEERCKTIVSDLQSGLRNESPAPNSRTECIAELCTIADLFRSYADSQWESKCDWTLFALQVLNIASTVDAEAIDVSLGYGACHLQSAMPLVQEAYDKLEEDEEYQGDLISSARKELDLAIKYLEKAYKGVVDSDRESDVVAMYAEALANRGNMEREDDEVQKGYWTKAIEVVNNAIEKGAKLPKELLEMISELQDD